MDKIVYFIFLFILIFSPLPYGSVMPWSQVVMECVSILGLLLLLIRNFKRKETFHEVPGLLPLSLFLGYMLFQIVPLPPAVVKIISPATFALYNETIGIIEPVGWISLSINKSSTLHEFFRFFAYACFYILTVQLLTQKDLLKRTVNIVIAFASFMAVAGIIKYAGVYFGKSGFIDLLHVGSDFGLYVNRNHFAGFMEMMFPIAMSLFLVSKPLVSYGSFRERLYDFFNQKRTSLYFRYGFSAVLIATSVFMSISRGGIISLCFALLIFVGALMYREARMGRGRPALIAFCAILICVTWFGWEPIFGRFEQIRIKQGEITLNGRFEIWRGCEGIIRDFPVTGTGFGTFTNSYPAYKTQKTTTNNAHNDYLELLVDGGIIAFVLAGWFLSILFFRSCKSFLKRREPYSIYLYLGSISGIISILFHSFTDVNIHIPANGLYFFFLCGLAVSAANTKLRKGLEVTRLRPATPIMPKVCGLIVGTVLTVCLVFDAGALVAWAIFFSVFTSIQPNENTPEQDLRTFRSAMEKAAKLTPLGVEYHIWTANTAHLLSDNQTALALYGKALRRAPLHVFLNHQKFAMLMSENGEHETVGRMMRAGVKFRKNNPKRHTTYASWLLENGEQAKGIEHMRTAIALEPWKADEYIAIMKQNSLNDEEVQTGLPELTEPYLIFAEYLEKSGKAEMAERAYWKSLEYAADDKRVSKKVFYRVQKFFRKQGRDQDALTVMLKAVEVLPDDARIRVTTAQLYEKLGITYRAIEEYRNGLVLDPENREAKKGLEKLVE